MLLKAFSSDTPQSIKLQNKVPKNTMWTQLWIEISQSEKRMQKTGIVVQSVLRAYRKITTGVQERKGTLSVYTMAAFLLFYFICLWYCIVLYI